MGPHSSDSSTAIGSTGIGSILGGGIGTNLNSGVEESRAVTTFPPQIKYIVGNEAAERFSFYGMRSILVVFMTQYLLFPKEDATATFHLFVSGCYLLPLLGAFFSDRFLGKYKTIMLFSSFYCLGHGALALWENQMGLFMGLCLIALGAGGIKPCVSAHVGDQFNSRNKHLVESVFNIFYWTINFGSFFSTMMIPVLLKNYGPSVAFGLPGLLMLVATVVFWLGRNLYVHVPPTGKNPHGFSSILWFAFSHRHEKRAGQNWLDVARQAYPDKAVEGARSALNIFKVFIMVSGFWALYDQHSSSWVLQAKQMNLNFWGMTLEPSQIAALNPIMVMGLIPVFSFLIYPGVEKLGFKMTPLRKMTAGMFLTGFSFVVVAIYQYLLDSGVSLSVGWHLIPFLVLTAAEVMISIPGLEFAYTQAPKEMKSTIMSFWFLTLFLGNMFTASIAKINVFQGFHFFAFFAVLMFVMAVAFAVSAGRYKMIDRMADTV